MTILTLDRAPTLRTGLTAYSAPDWLDGQWTLLFSDPDDFTRFDFEADRWLILLQEAFVAAEVRAAAVVSRAGRFTRRTLPCWLQAGGECPSLLLREARPEARVMHLRANALYQMVLDTPSRFVMILDSQLGLRRTIKYSCGDRLPSLFDLIAAAVRIRMTSSAPETHGNEPATSALGTRVRRVRSLFPRPAAGVRSCVR
jgi:hypothetical protein